MRRVQGCDPVTLGAGVIPSVERRPARDPSKLSGQQLEPFPDLLRVGAPGEQLSDHAQLGIHQPPDALATKSIIHQT